jgi:hypothetical protein
MHWKCLQRCITPLHIYTVQGNTSGPPSEVIDLTREVEGKLVLFSMGQHRIKGGGTCDSSLHQQHSHVGTRALRLLCYQSVSIWATWGERLRSC